MPSLKSWEPHFLHLTESFQEDKSVAVCSSHIDLPEGVHAGPKFLYFSQIECLFLKREAAFHAVTSQKALRLLNCGECLSDESVCTE